MLVAIRTIRRTSENFRILGGNAIVGDMLSQTLSSIARATARLGPSESFVAISRVLLPLSEDEGSACRCDPTVILTAVSREILDAPLTGDEEGPFETAVSLLGPVIPDLVHSLRQLLLPLLVDESHSAEVTLTRISRDHISSATWARATRYVVFLGAVARRLPHLRDAIAETFCVECLEVGLVLSRVSLPEGIFYVEALRVLLQNDCLVGAMQVHLDLAGLVHCCTVSGDLDEATVSEEVAGLAECVPSVEDRLRYQCINLLLDAFGSIPDSTRFSMLTKTFSFKLPKLMVTDKLNDSCVKASVGHSSRVMSISSAAIDQFCETGLLHVDGTCLSIDIDPTSPVANICGIRVPVVDMCNRSSSSEKRTIRSNLVTTPSTLYNLRKIAVAVVSASPIILVGENGSGKSFLIREMAEIVGQRKNLVELHLDDSIDSKALIGSYVCSDVPGEFNWKAGLITQAVTKGHWLVIEDIDSAPSEVVASLSNLIEKRRLYLPSIMQEIQAHPNFRIFGTIGKNKSTQESKNNGSIRFECEQTGRAALESLNLRRFSRHWFVNSMLPMPLDELRSVILTKFPKIAPVVVNRTIATFQAIRGETGPSATASESLTSSAVAHFIRSAISIRDIMKIVRRVNDRTGGSNEYITEGRKSEIIMEILELTLSRVRDVQLGNPSAVATVMYEYIITSIAQSWGVTRDYVHHLWWHANPQISFDVVGTEKNLTIGRVSVSVRGASNALPDQNDKGALGEFSNFAFTRHSLRILERIGAAVVADEPVLLVGETGTGKTTSVQELAQCIGKKLIVQNISLSTDVNDLFGGFKPVTIKQMLSPIYETFLGLFQETFSHSQNGAYLQAVAAFFRKEIWKKMLQAFKKAGVDAIRKLEVSSSRELSSTCARWTALLEATARFEANLHKIENGFAFSFSEGLLVDAMRKGHWILLDEINLASPETLQGLVGILDGQSLCLTERGDVEPVERHRDFRIFAAMNPPNDVGKRELISSLRSRFTEIYVDEMTDEADLAQVVKRGLGDAAQNSENIIRTIVDIYLSCRKLSMQSLVDSAGTKPRYSLRTLTRTLKTTLSFLSIGIRPLSRALFEAFVLNFVTCLNDEGSAIVLNLLRSSLSLSADKNLNMPPPRPGGRSSNAESWSLVSPFWLRAGPILPADWSEQAVGGSKKFVLTPSVESNIRTLAASVSANVAPILLQGPTSVGKTTMIEYLAARTGYECIRINNHEHTDVQEYIGGYIANTQGRLEFQDGLLVQALRRGCWIILDELNLAPSDVLEALNRLLDDNQELYIPETGETVKPATGFTLFATQNPPGVYGGRKPLSRAFKNRFIEIHVDDMPFSEIEEIVFQVCGVPRKISSMLVSVLKEVQIHRQESNLFQGKHGAITTRDLIKWGKRKPENAEWVALTGYVLLAEKLRIKSDIAIILQILESCCKVKLDLDTLYKCAPPRSFSEDDLKSVVRLRLKDHLTPEYPFDNDLKELYHIREQISGQSVAVQGIVGIAPTKTMQRMWVLVKKCLEYSENVLLVGETGCGKTTVCQLLAALRGQRLRIVNCHQSTETSDIIGGLRPIRNREAVLNQLNNELVALIRMISELRWSCNLSSLSAEALEQLSEVDQNAQVSVVAVRQALNEVNAMLPHLKEHPSLHESASKKVKLEEPGNFDLPLLNVVNHIELVIFPLWKKYNSLFEWQDGPLVEAMRNGDIFLLDEINLAEDAVIERLNSVLESGRVLTLVEKGTSDENDKIVAHPNFRFLATMNPGGDFGKRELSPALRSRFTELWIPAVQDRHDLVMIIKELMLHAFNETMVNRISEGIVQFTEWFEENCKLLHLNQLKLSVREILAWVQFIVDWNAKNSGADQVYLSFVHGAYVLFLDGLGLGMSTLNRDTIKVFKVQAVKVLLDLCPQNIRNEIETGLSIELSHMSESCSSHDGLALPSISSNVLSIGPFSTPCAPQFQDPSPDASNGSYVLNAGSTLLNLFRVLRALQLPRPILLEGPPGVGKTSLISTLAKVTGHKLIRINLSEHSEISDLLGTDLPAVDSSDPSTHSSPQFKWVDGVFLSALKNGDWVLLDELNLAPQSVLEGLNACFDHRGEVFLPEIGQTFKCPPSFRVFCAQNPVAEGGGRKGLPQSFLSRFSRVFVEAMTLEDLIMIAQNSMEFNPMTRSFLDEYIPRMVRFVHKLQFATSGTDSSSSFGRSGSPWEFNLRDTLRWLEVFACFARVIESLGEDTAQILHAHQYLLRRSASLLFAARMRTDDDKSAIGKLFVDALGMSLSSDQDAPVISISSHKVDQKYFICGWAKLSVSSLTRYSLVSHPFRSHGVSTIEYGQLYGSLKTSLENISFCVEQNWPVLLVGAPGSGKKKLVRYLAEQTGNHLLEFPMTSSIDASDLLGSFEQLNLNRSLHNTLRLAEDVVLSNCGRVIGGVNVTNNQLYQATLKKCCAALREIKRMSDVVLSMDALRLDSGQTLLRLLDLLVSDLFGLAQLEATKNEDTANMLSDLQGQVKILVEIATSINLAGFQWVDGILIDAMKRGFWLLFDNANLCSPSVLDRLNSLLEPNGTILLTESGEGQYLKPHPNFRVFFSMDPSGGEVSRAMRNRCVECFVEAPHDYDLLLKFAYNSTSHSPVCRAALVDTVDKAFSCNDKRIKTHITLAYCKMYAIFLNILESNYRYSRTEPEVALVLLDMLAPYSGLDNSVSLLRHIDDKHLSPVPARRICFSRLTHIALDKRALGQLELLGIVSTLSNSQRSANWNLLHDTILHNAKKLAQRKNTDLSKYVIQFGALVASQLPAADADESTLSSCVTVLLALILRSSIMCSRIQLLLIIEYLTQISKNGSRCVDLFSWVTSILSSLASPHKSSENHSIAPYVFLPQGLKMPCILQSKCYGRDSLAVLFPICAFNIENCIARTGPPLFSLANLPFFDELDYAVYRLTDTADESSQMTHVNSTFAVNDALTSWSTFQIGYAMSIGILSASESKELQVVFAAFTVCNEIESMISHLWRKIVAMDSEYLRPDLFRAIRGLMDSRDYLSYILRTSPRTLLRNKLLLPFDALSICLVWVSKSLEFFTRELSNRNSEFSEVVNLSLLNSKSVQKALEYIEVCFGRSGGQVRKNRLWKIGGHVEVPILAKDWNCLYTIRECMALLGPPQDADSSIAHMTSYLKFRRSESQLVEDCVGFSSTFYLLKTRERSWIGSERNFTLSSARLDADAVADEILRRCKSSRAVNIVDPDPVDETNELVVMERFAKNVKKLIESQEFECGFGLSVNLAEVFVVRQMVMICEAISSLAIELNAYLNSAGCGESALEQVKLGVARINQLSASTFFVAVHFSCLDPSLFRELRTLSWCAAALQEEFTSSSISQSKWTEFLSLLRTAVVSIETRCSSILNHKSAFGNLLSWSNRDLEDVLGINVLKSPSSNQASDSMRGRSRISALFLPKQLYFSLSHVDARALASKAKATRVMYSSPGESDIPTGMSPVVKKRLLESFRLLIATHSSSVAYKSKNYIECMSKLKLYSIDALLCFLDYFKNSRNEIDSVAHSVLDIMKFDLKIDRINFQSSLEALNEKILNCNSDAFLVSSEIEISKLRSLLWSEFLYPVLQYFGAFLYSGDAFDMVEIGLMWVRLGCLRAQLCLPSLPIDPSTKYATKASILSRHYDRLCSILTLSYSANTLGSISDVGAELKNLTNLCASLKKRINTLNARSIERPFNHGAENGRVLEAFVDVFEKLQIGTENLANPFNVLLSIKKIQTVVGFIKNQHSLSAKAVEEIHLLFAEAENRRESLNSFQANIYETLPEYEDVYSPLFSSLQNMSYGLGCVVTYIRQAFNNIAPISRTVSLTPNDAVSLIRYVTEYPFMKPTQSDLDRSVLPSLNNLLYYNTSLTKLSAVHTPCPAEPSAARKKFLSIFRLVLQRVEYFVDSDLISFQGASRLLRAAIELLLDNHRRSEEDRIKGEAEKASLYRTKDTSYVSDDAKEEEASLRKHFPDHLKELGIVSKGFISDENGAMDVSPNEREDSLKTSAAAHDSVLYLALDFGSLAVEVIGQELRMFMQYAPIDRHTAHFALVRHQDSRISAPIRRQELMRGLIDRTLLVAKEYAVNISEAIGESLDSDLLGLSCLALSVMASECDTSAGLARYDLSKFGGVDRDLMYLLYSGTNRYEKPLNFHTDRFGSELLTCAEPLKRLISRCSELLVQFPGNEILVHVCTLAVKLSNYHISTPLGKMLASLELLYRNAYEWESYAAKHVSMAEEISRLGSVIGKWRTLELQSWDHLLRVKEEEYIHKAANSWFPLTSSLLEFWPLEPSDVDMQPCAPTDCFYSYESLIPSWMMNHRLQAKTPDLDSTLINLFDTLDLFLKSCTVGEFPTRLHLVRLCALRLSRSTASNEPSLAKKSAFFVVFNLWKFYDQFLPSIRKFQEILKSPIQKRISDEIKISKWDQLSSYGLIEHSERIHRKLNKIIRQYQSDVLDYPVSSILRRETLGDMVDKAGEAVAAYQVPDLRQFFPYVDSAERDCLKVDLVDEDEEEEGAAIEKIKAGKIVSVPLPKKDKTNKKLKSEETMVVIERRASSFDYVLDQISNIWSVVPVSQELSDMIASSGAARLLKVDDLNRKLMKYLQTLLTIGGPCRWGLEVYELVEDVCNSIFFRIQALRPADVPRNAKYKALKDMFDGLENEVGISHLLSDSPDELRSPCFACTLPSPLFRETLIDSSWNFASPRDLSERGENYYFKCVSELNELRTQASCAASPDVGAREVAIMLALTENMFYKISHYRAKLCGHIDDLQRLGLQLSKYIAVLTTCEEKQQQNSASTISIRVIDSVESYWEQKQSMVNSVINATSELEVLVQAAVESLESTETNDRLNQFAAIVGSSSLTDVKKALSELRGLKADLDSCATPLIADVEGSAIMFDSAICSQMSLEVMSSFKSKPRSLAKIRAIEEAEIVVSSAYVKMKSIVETLSSAVPDTVSSRVLEIFASSVKGLSRCAEELRNPAVSVKDDKTEGNLLNDLGEIFEYDLIRIQNLKECAETFSNMDSKSAKSISEKLEQAHNSMVALALKDTTMKLSKFYSSLVNSSSATSCRNVISALRAVIPSTISLFMGSISIVDDLIKSQKSMCKLTYVCIRVFRTIIAKGFCGSKVKEEAGDGNGDAENMTFEDDVEGTGMGEGDGKKDVSDQIQNEEQLLGLKSDESKPPSEEAQQPEKKLNKEEKDKGVEMTQDFDGDMFDVPSSDESSHNSDQENEDDEDELDREMDNDGEINQKNVVDEKMWGSDDELDESKEEKFEDNSKSKGETLDGEMTTKQNGEEEDDISSHNDNDRDDDSKAPNGGKEDEAEEHGKDINEDTAERHVEKPLGVDVRESENENSGQEDEKDQDEEGSQGVDKMEELDSQEEESDGMPPFESDPNAQAMEDSELPENLPEDMELDDAASLEGSQDDGDDGAEAENDLPNEGDIDAESHEYQIDGSVGDEPDQDNLVKGGDQDHAVELDAHSRKHQKSANASAFGVQSKGGQDSIQAAEKGHDGDERNRRQQDALGSEGDGEGAGGSSSDQSSAQNAHEKQELSSAGIDDSNGGSNSGNDKGSADGTKSRENSMSARSREAPNPFRKKGDLSKAWFERLDLKRSNKSSSSQRNQESQSQGGTFEFELNSGHDAQDDNAVGDQVLAETVDGDAAQLPEQGHEDQNANSGSSVEKSSREADAEPQDSSTDHNTGDGIDSSAISSLKRNREDITAEDASGNAEGEDGVHEGRGSDERSKKKSKVGEDEANYGDSVVAMDDSSENVGPDTAPAMDIEDAPQDSLSAELENLNGNKFGGKSFSGKFGEILNAAKKNGIVEAKLDDEVDELSFKSIDALQSSLLQSDGAELWARHKALAEESSASLCEQLRLILEPNLTARLRGDYRTGKRINMRKVISYVASGFRRDKIWLRRTKLAKRSYQVMLMIDDTYSMGAAGSLALTSLAIISGALTRLEVGELCVASFSDRVNILHPFGATFSDESGSKIASSITFKASKTLLADALQSVIPVFEEARHTFGGRTSGDSKTTVQLCFLLSDARLDTDNRSRLQSVVRDMAEKHIMVVLIIIDHNVNSRDSIFNTKSIEFTDDGIVTRPYLQDFPFPFYVAIQKLSALPVVLSDSLRQWFEFVQHSIDDA